MDERFLLYLDGALKFPINCKRNENLTNLRKIINSKNITNFTFIMDNESIQVENEENFLISDLLQNKKLYIKSNKQPKDIPIPGSILKYEKDGIKFYSYPQEELTEIEKIDSNNTKNILFIGKSGDGKTTFINALINAILNIKGESDLRYKFVFEESKEGQDKSQTEKIKIYNIKIKDKPILRLIDSPGFFDTEGKEEDNIEQFRALFKNEISYLHCICFVMKFSSYRRNQYQIELCKKVSSLFAEEIKNNFIFILTHYTFTGSFDAKASLLKEEVFKDIVLDNNVFKLDSECAFTGEKDLRNIMWAKTTEEMQKIINEKFYILKSVNTAQSAEVIQKRNELNRSFNKGIKDFKNKLIEIKNSLDKNSLTYRKKISMSVSSVNINTNCRICHKTCQARCECDPLLNIRYFCNIFNFWGFCRECDCHFIRHERENNQYLEEEKIMNFKNKNERENFMQQEVKEFEKNKALNFDDIKNTIDKTILKDYQNDLKKSFGLYYGGIEEGSFDKLIKYKKIEAIRIVLKIHNAIEDINQLALNKTIDNNIEKFFNQIKKLDEFKNDGDIIEKIKIQFLELNGGNEKNNISFHIVGSTHSFAEKKTFKTIEEDNFSEINTTNDKMKSLIGTVGLSFNPNI
jgi:GTP-binding protein EngB required for normal cell division